uniref:TCF3 fusion partner n=1 Tax=Macrostomum lignano TaxID=282301 RepID=A0A1I8JPK5_9PLAT
MQRPPGCWLRSCKAGFRQSAKSARESVRTRCRADPSPAFGAALDAEKLIDDLAVSSSMNEKDSDSEKLVQDRSGKAGEAPTGPAPPNSSGGRKKLHGPTPPRAAPPLVRPDQADTNC